MAITLSAVEIGTEIDPGEALAREPREEWRDLRSPLGTVRVRLRGLTHGERSALWPRFVAARRAYVSVVGGEDPGSLVTYAERLPELGDLPQRAERALLASMRDYARLGVLGWEVGEICGPDGAAIFPHFAFSRVAGEQRSGLVEGSIDTLQQARLLLEIVAAVEELSRAEGDAGSPFGKAPHEHRQSSPSTSAPPSRSDSGAASSSAGGQRSAPSASGSLTAPPAPPASDRAAGASVTVWP